MQPEEKPIKRSPKEKPFYVSSVEFDKEIRTFYETEKWTPFLATAIQKIARGVAHRHNFIKYSYKDDMISTAIYNMSCALTRKFYRLDSGFSSFGYFTAIAWHACLEVIKKEERNRNAIREYRCSVYKDMLNSNLDRENSIYVEDTLSQIVDDINDEKERKKFSISKEEYNAHKPKRQKIKKDIPTDGTTDVPVEVQS